MKVNDYVLVKHEYKYQSPVSAHRTHKVIEVYPDKTMLLQGFSEPVKMCMFDKMRTGKVKSR